MLPNLPKQRNKKEADFGLKFRKWAIENKVPTGAYELKQCTDSLPFSDVKDHQIAALLAVNGKGLLWKIADDSRGIKPFDYFYLKGEAVFIVIKYSKMFCLIDINTFLLERKRSKRKSLTSARAEEICYLSVKL